MYNCTCGDWRAGPQREIFPGGYEGRCRALKDQKKRSSLIFRPIFCPKVGEDQKKRSSLKLRPIFCSKLGEDQKKVFFQIETHFLPRIRWRPEMESSRTSLVSRTHFEVLGLGLGLGLEASSPWPWPRSLKSSKIALSSARGEHYFLNSWNFVGKRQKPRGKFANTFFVFLTWSIGVGKGRGAEAPPNCYFTNDKTVIKRLLFLQFQFRYSIFRWQEYNCLTILKTRGAGSPSIQFLPANLNV